jgi:hypothetical protein
MPSRSALIQTRSSRVTVRGVLSTNVRVFAASSTQKPRSSSVLDDVFALGALMMWPDSFDAHLTGPTDRPSSTSARAAGVLIVVIHSPSVVRNSTASTSRAKNPARHPNIISTVLPDGLLVGRRSLISALSIVKGLGPATMISPAMRALPP